MAEVVMTKVADDLPSNSSKSRGEEPIEKPKAEKVISGTVKVRKKGLKAKFLDTFLSDDIGNVKNYIVYDMVIPGIKEVILGGIEMMFFGSTRGGRNRSRSAGSNPSKASYISYNSYSRGARPEERRSTARTSEIEDLIFESAGEAELVLDELRDEIDRFGEATLASYYEKAGYSGNFTDYKYGWTNLDEVRRPHRVRGGGYILELPRPRLLD